jgi:hypothetical protein
VLRTIPLAVIVIASAFGCATPQPVVRLHPTSPDVVWHSGRAIVTRQTSNVRVAVAFERMAEERLMFRVEFQNLGPQPRDVGPHLIVYRSCIQPQQCGPRTRVIDPEERLLALDVARSRRRASQTNEAGLGAALVLLNAVATVGTAAQGKGEEASRLASDGLMLAESTSHSIQRHEDQIAMIEAEKVDWAASALRRTTLGAQQGIAGFVHVPLEVESTRIWLGVLADGPPLWFGFEQRVIVATPAGRVRSGS